uniref:Chromodomain helicase DNA binding protein 6 n=1 Tax=Neolamprologus brichardi TaxID=32507 RepID=A0A3Q4HM05_NEOBR
MFTGLLKHTPPQASAAAASSSSSDQNSNAQTTAPTIPRGHLVVGTKDQLRLLTPVGSTVTSNHCTTSGVHAAKHSGGAPRPPSSMSEEDDGGGGGRVKKKRKKKDKREWEKAGVECEEKESSKPKKRREEREPIVVSLRKSKEPKEAKEGKERKERRTKGKEGRTESETVLKNVSGVKTLLEWRITHQNSCPYRDPGAAPVEKKKKGKRRNQELAVQEGVESDDTTSMSAINMGGEDSQDPLDNAKRRSGRQVKRRKYNEDLDFKVVDDDGETIAVLGAGRIAALNATALAWQAEEPPEDEANIIEKILAVRTVKKEKDPRIHQKIKRFRTKQAQMKHLFAEPDEDLFNPDYVEVDRVLEVAVTTDTETGEEVTHYLVKWCSLSYEEATWELQEDLDPEKIKEFEEIQKLPADLRHIERPSPEKWQKLERSRDYRNGNQLREYQLEGMNWLLFNWYNRKNCILADEMGLGKTIQSITFLYEIFSMGIRGPFLIIAPLSTITNWEREFRTWTHMNVIVYHGSQISRQMILQYEMFHRDPQGNTIPGVLKFHGLITTFEMIMADCPELKKLHWRCVVIDEAHRLKNRNCKLLEGLKLMNLEHKVLLTGTPLQNSVEELFSLLNFLEPLQFPSESTFLEEFGDLKTDEQVKKLQAILKPMMLRRLKDDVEKNLAPKEETIIEVELTNIQKKYYRAILEKNFSFLSKGANQHNMPNLINTMMELRKCCNHPYLITGAEEKILESFKKSHSPEAPDFQLQAMIQAAGKLVLIDKLLPKLLAGGHKVLVFSQMVRCLDILEDYLIQRRYTYERIDGRVRGNLRQAAIDRFCKPDSDRFVFLLCTRAGGLGINLTAADTCIIFDSDWNPQNDLQAQARCHRIGQSKAVKVYRLITRNSYEREMFDKASLKLGLDKAVLQDINRKGSLNGVQQLSKLEVEDLLKKGAYGALMDEEDEGSKFCEEDIDQILQRRTQTITIQSEGKGSTFAKASFISSGNRTDISLDDPNFWQKWAKIAEVEIDSKSEKESLVIDTPRVRKQTRHYNSFEDDELMEFSELDSDSEERPCRTRRLGERSRRYLRAECFRVEKNLLIFGWGRWKDILNHGRFKWHLTERDMEVICRALLVYCLRHYKGDDKIKSFIWDLITPTKEGQDQALVNHSGLSAPVPRGRKGKKLKNQLNVTEVKNADWLVHCNPEVVLQDESYKKHLKQHCNKVLLRVRMLYYLKVEVLGEAATQGLEGVPASKLEVPLPDIDYIEIPVSWWDAEADKSLLIGVHKHGYERYNAMRADPDLCFLERVGMPDVTALSSEQGGGEVASDVADSKSSPETILVMCFLLSSLPLSLSLHVVQARPLWPTGPALTARLRRLITAYQRFTLRREPLLRHDFIHHAGGPLAWQLGEDLRRCSVVATEPDPLFLEWQRRWTRREQADFYRTVSSFGVVYDPERKAFDWSQFRALARLERKTDESLERYFNSFVNMCRTACKLPPRKEEGLVDPAVIVEPLTEERAARTLYRIELLRKIREQVLRHPLLSARLQLCRPSLYLPVWWESGKHDRDLLIGAARHGLSRTDFYILNDPQLSFLEAHRNYVRGHPLPHPHCCLYDSGLGRHSPQPPEYPHQSSHHHHHHHHSLGIVPGPRGDFLDCPPLDETLELGTLQHDTMSADSLHGGKVSKDALNGFPFNSAAGGQSMLNSYGVGGTDLDSKLRSDVLVGEQGSSEETGLMAPSVELDQLQAPWDSTDHTSPAHHMFNESDPILGPSTLETGFLEEEDEEAQGGDRGGEEGGTLEECLGLPPSSPPSHPSAGDSVEPLSSSYMLFKVGFTSLADHTDLSASPPLPYVPPPPLSLSDITAHEPQDGLGHSDVSESLTNPVEDGDDREESTGFEFDDKEEEEVEDLSRETLEQNVEKQRESSEIKPEAKPEVLGFTALSEVKTETKHEMLEADSTVLTPKLEQNDGLVETSESAELKGQVKEERPSTPGFSASPRFAAPISVCEIPDSLHETREPTIAQLLQEKALYSFSEWPKDRVIINRLDSICHAILKGKWPSSSEQYDSPAALAANSCLANSLAQHHQHRAGFLSTTASGSVPTQARERLVAPAFLPELKRAGGRRSFDYEAAAAAAAKVLAGKSASSCHTAVTTSSSSDKAPVVAPPSHRTGAILINGWQEAAIDLTKSSGEISTTSNIGTNEAVVAPGISHLNAGAGSSHKIPPPPPITAPLPGPVGIDMAGILQAGLIHPVTGQIVNGSLRGDDSMRRRRGRRRNVEALYSEFTKSRGLHLPESQGRVEVISHSSVSSSTSSPSPSPSERPAGPPTPSSSSTPTPTQTPPQPEIVAIDREAAGKGLIEWLRQNPGYTMDLPAFAHSGAGLLHGFVERPKQRRHRCKDPTKLDINSLTGEERVPVVHRGTGRRLGGAMAPAIKELSRWLDANSEYYVAPDWADVVKHSGFLPEGKFSRILTEPVNKDPSSRRRGRRPRSEMPKPLLSVSDSSSPGLGPPLFMNGGLIGSMDSMVAMQNLRSGIPGIPISGIMAAGFPHGFPAAVSAGGAGGSAEDAKNGLSMLPMMLHGIPHPHGAAIPQHALFSVGTMMAHTPPPPSPHPSSSSSSSTSSSSSASAVKVTTTTAPSATEAASPSSTTPAEREGSAPAAGGEKDRTREEKGAAEANKRPVVAEAAAIITSTTRAHLSSAHLGAGTGSHLTFNPFLIPGMSHGLLYPHMFLPHGGIMALPAMPPGAVDSSPGSPKRRKKRGREEVEREEEREKAATGDGEERESTDKAGLKDSPLPALSSCLLCCSPFSAEQQCKICAVSVSQCPCKDFYYDDD